MKLKRNNPNARQRIIQFELNPNKEQCIILNAMTYSASKLWNVANYERIEWKKESGNPYPDWYEQKAKLKENFWYKNSPSQTAQKSNRKYRGLYATNGKVFNADCVGAYNILKKYLCRIDKTNPTVVALDTPEMYRWNGHHFIENPKLANLLAM